MKILLLVEDGRTQVVLKPETPHEKAVCDTLETLPNTYRDEFYQCQGGYTRHNGPFSGPMDQVVSGYHDKDLVIVIDAIPHDPRGK